MVGYALHWTPLHAEEYHSAAKFRERWRFRHVEAPDDGDGELPAGWSGDFEAPQLRVVEWALEEAGRRTRASPAERVGRAMIEEELSPQAAGIEQLPDSFVRRDCWRRIVVGAWQFPGVIHELEGRICLAGLRRSCRTVQHHQTKLLSLCDNMSALCALEKGRAGPYPLRRLCQKSAALHMSCWIPWMLRYIESARNPTDEDSRQADRGALAKGELKVFQNPASGDVAEISFLRLRHHRRSAESQI